MYNSYIGVSVFYVRQKNHAMPCHAMMASHAKEGLTEKSERVKRAKKKLGNKYIV